MESMENTVEILVEFFVEKTVEKLCDPSVVITTRPLTIQYARAAFY